MKSDDLSDLFHQIRLQAEACEGAAAEKDGWDETVCVIEAAIRKGCAEGAKLVLGQLGINSESCPTECKCPFCAAFRYAVAIDRGEE
jgi:hypothetical protein